jgi:hypothetical protein
MMFFALLRGDRVSDKWILNKVVLSAPFEIMRDYSLHLIGVIMAILVVVRVNELLKTGVRSISFAVLFISVFNAFVMVRQYSVGMTYLSNCLMAISVYMAYVVIFGFPRVMSVDGATDYCAQILVVGFSAFALGSIVEASIDRNAVMWNGRFSGITSHPVFCGVISSLGATAAAHLILIKVRNNWIRMLSFFAAPIGVGFVIASGTRTGALMFVASLIGLGWQHFRKQRGGYVITAFIFLFICGLAYGGYKALNVDDGGGDERLVSSENTRAEAWERMIKAFSEKPISGVPDVAGEGSYLMAAATTGVVGLIPFSISIFSFGYTTVRVLSTKSGAGKGGALAGLSLSLLVLGLAESYLLDTATYPLLSFYVVAMAMASVKIVHRVSDSSNRHIRRLSRGNRAL